MTFNFTGTIHLSNRYTLDITHDFGVMTIACRPVFMAPKVREYPAIRLQVITPTIELVLMVVQVMLESVPVPVFADYLEDHGDDYGLRNENLSDFEELLRRLRWWGSETT